MVAERYEVGWALVSAAGGALGAVGAVGAVGGSTLVGSRGLLYVARWIEYAENTRTAANDTMKIATPQP